MHGAHERIIFPLDVDELDEAKRWIDRLVGRVGVFKVGLELFVKAGPEAVRAVHGAGGCCFLDLKLHDIPATMAGAVSRAVDLGVAFITVHAAAGPRALAASVDAARGAVTRLLAVTVLTSLDDSDLRTVGVVGTSREAAARLARISVDHGVSGLVCSAEEAADLRDIVGSSGILVVPGVRPAGAAPGDQSRVATPARAVRAGADYLVVGRPIRMAPNPVAAAEAIAREIDEAGSRLL